MAMKRAILFAPAIEVTCPHCGEPLPSPDNGSDMWLPTQVRDASGQTKTCDSCDEPFVIADENKVQVSR